jgi:hypothetical protein
MDMNINCFYSGDSVKIQNKTFQFFRKDKNMSIIIDEKVEDAKMLHTVAIKYAPELAENGTSAEDIAALASQIDIVRNKVVNQQNAKGDARGATKEQNTAANRSARLIRRVKLMAQSVFRNDPQILSSFHIDDDIPRAVKTLRTELDYMKSQVEKNKVKLAKKGLKDSEIEKFTALEAELAGKDVEQEAKQISGKSATKLRDHAVETLDEMMEDIRISADLAFEEDESKLEEFKSIFSHRSAKKGNNGGQAEDKKVVTETSTSTK